MKCKLQAAKETHECRLTNPQVKKAYTDYFWISKWLSEGLQEFPGFLHDFEPMELHMYMYCIAKLSQNALLGGHKVDLYCHVS